MRAKPGWRQTDDLGSQVRAGLVWSLCNNLFGRAGQVVMGIVLAHLLAPREFGIFSAALVAFALIINISELGVSVAIVRDPARTEEIAPTVATLSITSSSALAAGLFVAAPTIASVLNTPSAAGSLRVLSLALIIAGITAVPAAMVQQRFRQDVRMAADVTSLAVSLAVAVPLAATGFGASSLAWAWVASNAASAAILIVFVGRRWRPGFDRREAGQLLRFGLPLAASSLLVFAVLNVDYVVVSRLLGPVALGVYVLAFNLSSWPVNMFSASVRSVSLPGFARLIDRPADLGAAFTRSLGQLLSVALPICALLGGLALPAVRFVYGDRWAGASQALVWLAIVGGLRVAFELAYDFVVAIGDSRAVLYVQILWLVALVPSLVVGGHLWGIAGIGAAQLVVAACVVCPTYLVLLKRRHVVLREVATVTVRPLLGAVAAVLVARLVYPQFQEPLVGLVLAALAGLCVDALVLWPTIRRWRAGRTRPVLSATGSAVEPTHADPAPLTPAMADAVAGVGARGAQ